MSTRPPAEPPQNSPSSSVEPDATRNVAPEPCGQTRREYQCPPFVTEKTASDRVGPISGDQKTSTPSIAKEASPAKPAPVQAPISISCRPVAERSASAVPSAIRKKGTTLRLPIATTFVPAGKTAPPTLSLAG